MKSVYVWMVLALVIAPPAWAAKDSREKQMLRRVQQQVQQAEHARVQAEQEKASLLAEKESLEKEFKQTQSDVGTAKREAALAKSENVRIEKEVVSLRKELADMKALLETADRQLSDNKQQQLTTVRTLAETETVKNQTELSLQDKTKTLQVCREHNGRLYTLGKELIAKYQEKSCKDSMLQKEPFTGLKKVEMENLFESWRDSLDRDKMSNKGPEFR